MQTTWEQEWRSALPAAPNILCVRLDTMGDVLMTSPAFRALKASFPGCRLTLLTSPSGAAIAALIPEIDAIKVYLAPWMKTNAASAAAPHQAQIAELRDEGYDATIIFTVFSQNPLPTALMLFLAEIPLRLAYCRENPYQLLTHWAPEVDTYDHMRHEVLRHLDLVAAIGAATENEHLSLQAPEGAWQAVQGMLQQAGLDLAHPWLLIHPGATAASRRYPPASFARASAALLQRGFQLVFTGDASERPLVQDIRLQALQRLRPKTHASHQGGGVDVVDAEHRARSFPGTFSLAGLLDLPQLAALIQHAPLLISNNTGPAHMAAALGTPVVDIYALTNPQHTPWQVPHRVLNHDVPCKYCYKSVCPLEHHNCLRLLAPHEVVHAALDLLRETGRLPDALPGLVGTECAAAVGSAAALSSEGLTGQ